MGLYIYKSAPQNRKNRRGIFVRDCSGAGECSEITGGAMVGECLCLWDKSDWGGGREYNLKWWNICAGGAQGEREERVSLELSEELVRSMEPGAVFRDYVSFSIQENWNRAPPPRCWLIDLLWVQNCRISSIDFNKNSSYMVTASDDDSIRLYDVATATWVSMPWV